MGKISKATILAKAITNKNVKDPLIYSTKNLLF